MRKQEEFRPEITISKFGGGDVWRWTMPDGKMPVNGVVANKPIEQCVAEYVKHLAEFHQRQFSAEDVKVGMIFGTTPDPVAVPLRENKIREKAEAKPRPAKRAPVNELCELVPAMNLWNRAGLLADEVVAEFNKDRNYITSQEGPVLWKIVQTKVNLLLTELRADTELRVKRAREGN